LGLRDRKPLMVAGMAISGIVILRARENAANTAQEKTARTDS